MTGVDRTRAFLDRARDTADKEGLAIEWIQEDMRAFKRANAFDGAINCVTSFGYFADQAEDLTVARNLHDSLKASARLVIEMMGKEILARRFQERTWDRLPNDAMLLQERSVRSGWDWIETHWIMLGRSRRKEITFTHRPYSGAEIRELLKQAGFREVGLFGSLSGSAYDQDAIRLVAVATK